MVRMADLFTSVKNCPGNPGSSGKGRERRGIPLLPFFILGCAVWARFGGEENPCGKVNKRVGRLSKGQLLCSTKGGSTAAPCRILVWRPVWKRAVSTPISATRRSWHRKRLTPRGRRPARHAPAT